MPLAESSSLRHQDAQIRDPEEETETDSPEPVMKKQEESPGSLSMKELVMKLVTKKQKGDADTLSMKKLEKRCGRINAGPRQITNPANYKKDGDTREAEAISLKISSEETSTTKKIGGVTEKPTLAADINKEKSSANYSLVPPNLTDSEHDSEYDLDKDCF